MKTKFLTLTDSGTIMRCIILQLDECDRSFGEPSGVAPGLKIVLKLEPGTVSCFAGYELREEFGATIDRLSTPMRNDGTMLAFKELLHAVPDIRLLPDELSVEQLRLSMIDIDQNRRLKQALEVIDEGSPGDIRKLIYECNGWVHTAIVDVIAQDVVFDSATTSSQGFEKYEIAQYLWIPLPEATDEELSGVNITPFRYRRL